MSKVAGRMSVLAAAHCLVSPQGEAGLLLGGVPGAPAAKVTTIGGAVVGAEAAKIAVGMRAIVRILDVNPKRPTYRNRRRRGVQYDSQWWDENREPVTDGFSQWLLGEGVFETWELGLGRLTFHEPVERLAVDAYRPAYANCLDGP